MRLSQPFVCLLALFLASPISCMGVVACDSPAIGPRDGDNGATAANSSTVDLPVRGDAPPVDTFRALYRALVTNDVDAALQTLAPESQEQLEDFVPKERGMPLQVWLSKYAVECREGERLSVRNVFLSNNIEAADPLAGQIEALLVLNNPVREKRSRFDYRCSDESCATITVSPINELVFLVEEVSENHARCAQ